MQFLLDENVMVAVADIFRKLGYRADFSRDIISEGAPDELVAIVAQANNYILVSHDRDFNRLTNGRQKRFRKLSRIHLHCDALKAVDRLEKAFELIEFEKDWVDNNHLDKLFIQVGNNHIRTNR